MNILNRIIRCAENGVELEADLRHAELIVSQLGLTESKKLTCPAPDEVKRDDGEEALNAEYSCSTCQLSINRQTRYTICSKETGNKHE